MRWFFCDLKQLRLSTTRKPFIMKTELFNEEPFQ